MNKIRKLHLFRNNPIVIASVAFFSAFPIGVNVPDETGKMSRSDKRGATLPKVVATKLTKEVKQRRNYVCDRYKSRVQDLYRRVTPLSSMGKVFSSKTKKPDARFFLLPALIVSGFLFVE